MRILLCSHCFHPSVGGIETVSRLLAEELSSMGHQVTVVTQTPGSLEGRKYAILRRPSMSALLAAGRRSEVVLQSNISLKTLCPLLLLRKPITIAHHTWLTRANGNVGWQDRLKLLLLRCCCNVAISEALARTIPGPVTVIPNPFELKEFNSHSTSHRDRDFVFVGRLVSDKGCDVALRAFAILLGSGVDATFTIIGDGAELLALTALATQLGVAHRVQFIGMVQEGRGKILSRHRVIVIPSRWNEPFGLVALEGIAAGCAVVATDGGGLPEAVGACGICIPREDPQRLAEAMGRLLADEEERCRYTQFAPDHLRRYSPDVVARDYEKLLLEQLPLPLS